MYRDLAVSTIMHVQTDHWHVHRAGHFRRIGARYASVTSALRCVLAGRTRNGPFGIKLLSPRVSD
jgi:LPS sulfotransferase NodH